MRSRHGSKRAGILVIVMCGAFASAALPGCALFSGQPPKRELLLLVTAHIVLQDEDPQVKPDLPPAITTQYAILARIIEAEPGFIDGIGVKWQTLVAPENKHPGTEPPKRVTVGNTTVPAPQAPPIGWGASGTEGWAERVQRTSSLVQWAPVDREHVMAIIKGVQSTPARGNILTAPRVTVFPDQLAFLTVSTRRSFVRVVEEKPREPNLACMAMAHFKTPHELRLYAEVLLSANWYTDSSGFLDSVLTPHAPGQRSNVYPDDPPSWRIDFDRVCIVTDMPDGGTIAIRCPEFRSR